MAKIYVAFGDYATTSASEHKWSELKRQFEDNPSRLGKRTFNTDKELDAYVSGLFDALGWNEVYVLTDDETKSLSKQIPLSEIPDLAENG